MRLPATAPRRRTRSNHDLQRPQQPALFINRELSWLAFNERVLAQGAGRSHPLLERVKFLAITGTNLDEFFMVRVATILKKFRAGIEECRSTARRPISSWRRSAAARWRRSTNRRRAGACRCGRCSPRKAFTFLEPAEYTPAIEAWLAQYFKDHIFPVLTPLAFDPGPPVPVYLEPQHEPGGARPPRGPHQVRARQGAEHAAALHRAAGQPVAASGVSHVFLEDVIRRNIQQLFPGTQVEGAHLFRIIRDTDMVIQETKRTICSKRSIAASSSSATEPCRCCRSKATCRSAC
jgi:polyphosphate kinase